MDSQIDKGDIAFDILKNIIIKQNEKILKVIAEHYNVPYQYLRKKYIKLEYYLPIVE